MPRPGPGIWARALPGTIIIGADSHTCTYGALNSFATGVGSTDMAAALISGKMWFKVPETIKLVYNGKLQKGVYSKDVALHMVGTLTRERCDLQGARDIRRSRSTQCRSRPG